MTPALWITAAGTVIAAVVTADGPHRHLVSCPRNRGNRVHVELHVYYVCREEFWGMLIGFLRTFPGEMKS